MVTKLSPKPGNSVCHSVSPGCLFDNSDSYYYINICDVTLSYNNFALTNPIMSSKSFVFTFGDTVV